MSRTRRPTPAQVAVIAYFAGPEYGYQEQYRTTNLQATYRVCVRNGWIEPTEEFPFHRATPPGRAFLPATPTRDDAHVRRMLDLSTAHLPADIDPRGIDGVDAYQLPHGWMLWVPTDPARHLGDYWRPLPRAAKAVLAVQRAARARECDWVLLDSDGPTLAGLKVYPHA